MTNSALKERFPPKLPLCLIVLWCMVFAGTASAQSVTFRDVTATAGLRFTHNNGAFGKKWLPETMGPGCAFLDYDEDGYPDILLVNGTDFAGHPKNGATTPHLLSQQRQRHFHGCNARSPDWACPLYGFGAAIGDYDNDGHDDIFISALGQSHLFHNNGNGTFTDVTKPLASGAERVFYQRRVGRLRSRRQTRPRGRELRAMVCARRHLLHAGWRNKSYCTPESYKGSSARLWHNLGGGKFEDATAEGRILRQYFEEPWCRDS